MHAWEQIQLTLDYIEGHLEEEIDIQELAKLAALSPFYFQRLFSRLVKKPVAEYVKLRRLFKAAEMLPQSNRRILDIALQVGFRSHEHFTRAFKEAFAMTPEEYRAHPQALNRMTKPELALHYTLIDEGVPLITDGIVLEVGRRRLAAPLCFVGVEKQMPVRFVEGLGTASGVDPLDALWRGLHEQKEAALGIPEDSEELGVSYPSRDTRYFTYFAGAKALSEKAVSGFTSWLLPQGEYIVCSFEAESFEALVMDALYKAQQYMFGVWLPRHGLQTEPFCAERYACHGPQTTSMEIWLKPL